MTVKDLELLYDYGHWANRKLFDVVSQLSHEQFTQQVSGSYGSVRNTLVHVLSAEWGWLDRCGGFERGDRLNNDDYPTFEPLQETWSKVEMHMREFLAELKDEDLTKSVGFPNARNEKRSMPLGELLHHGAIHGVHHRGQVVLLLRSLGYVPGNFDIIFYYADKRGTVAW